MASPSAWVLMAEIWGSSLILPVAPKFRLSANPIVETVLNRSHHSPPHRVTATVLVQATILSHLVAAAAT